MQKIVNSIMAVVLLVSDGSGVDRNCAAESRSVNNLPVQSKFEEFAK